MVSPRALTPSKTSYNPTHPRRTPPQTHKPPRSPANSSVLSPRSPRLRVSFPKYSMLKEILQRQRPNGPIQLQPRAKRLRERRPGFPRTHGISPEKGDSTPSVKLPSILSIQSIMSISPQPAIPAASHSSHKAKTTCGRNSFPGNTGEVTRSHKMSLRGAKSPQQYYRSLAIAANRLRKSATSASRRAISRFRFATRIGCAFSEYEKSRFCR